MVTLRFAGVAGDISGAKRSLRREMLDIRRSITDGPAGVERSVAVCERLVDAVAARFEGVPSAAGRARPGRDGRAVLHRVLAYDAGAGEVDLGPLLGAWRSEGVEVVLPAAAPNAVLPVSPAWPDLIMVPGVAFDPGGGRLGRGGGWYDQLLGDPSRQALAVGVAFAAQIVRSVPCEEHDVRVDLVVTERGVE